MNSLKPYLLFIRISSRRAEKIEERAFVTFYIKSSTNKLIQLIWIKNVTVSPALLLKNVKVKFLLSLYILVSIKNMIPISLFFVCVFFNCWFWHLYYWLSQKSICYSKCMYLQVILLYLVLSWIMLQFVFVNSCFDKLRYSCWIRTFFFLMSFFDFVLIFEIKFNTYTISILFI